MPLVALDHFQPDKFRRCLANDLAPEPAAGLFVYVAVAPNEAAFKQRRADGQILLRHFDRLIQRPAGLADFQPQIPQQIEYRLDHLLGP